MRGRIPRSISKPFAKPLSIWYPGMRGTDGKISHSTTRGWNEVTAAMAPADSQGGEGRFMDGGAESGEGV